MNVAPSHVNISESYDHYHHHQSNHQIYLQQKPQNCQHTVTLQSLHHHRVKDNRNLSQRQTKQ